MHSSLAVTLTGTPLGLTAVKFWTRQKYKGTFALKWHVNPTRVPIETKESYRWLEKPAPVHCTRWRARALHRRWRSGK
jgi:hypothetical protein